jgi:hypothetical protein
MSHPFIGSSADQVLPGGSPQTYAPGTTAPVLVKVMPSAEVTQFASGTAVLPSNNSENNAVKTASWYCGNCFADKQIYIQWSNYPSPGQAYSHKVQWCAWDSAQDSDWVDDTSIGQVDLAAPAGTTHLLIPTTRYGAYLRLKVWQSGSASITVDAFGMGKWS